MIAAEHAWRRRRALATGTSVVGHVGPAAAVLTSAFAVGVLLGRGGSLGEVTWWVAVLSVGVVVHLALQPAAQRALILAGLLRMHVEFPSVPPSRWSVVHHPNSPSTVRARLDEASRAEWTPENQTRRAVLVATLTVLESQRRDAEVVFRIGDRDVSTQVLLSEIPGFLQLTRFRPDRRRWLLAGVTGAAVAAVLTSAALGNGGRESSTDASRGPASGTLGMLPTPTASAPDTHLQSSGATAQPVTPLAPAPPELPPETGSEHTPSGAAAGVAGGAPGAVESTESSASLVRSDTPPLTPTLSETSGGVIASDATVVDASQMTGGTAGPSNGAAVDQVATADAAATGKLSTASAARIAVTGAGATDTTREPVAEPQSTVKARGDRSTCATEREPYRDEPSADALTSPRGGAPDGSDLRASDGDDDNRAYDVRDDSEQPTDPAMPTDG